MFYDYLMHCVAINYVSFLPMRYYYKWCLKSICLRVHRFYRPFSTRRLAILRPGGGRWFCFGLNRSWPRESSPLYTSPPVVYIYIPILITNIARTWGYQRYDGRVFTKYHVYVLFCAVCEWRRVWNFQKTSFEKISIDSISL